MPLASTQVLVDGVGQEVRSIRNLLDFYERELPSYTCQHFLSGVRTVLDILEDFHQQRVKFWRASSEVDAGIRDEQLRFLSNYVLGKLASVHEVYLSYLDSARHQNEYLILPSITRAIHVLERDIELVLVPQFEYCYGLVGFHDFVRQAIEKLGNEQFLDKETKTKYRNLAKSSRKWTAFLAYPIAEKASALNMTVLAHELAHLADWTTRFCKKLLPLKLDKDSFHDLIKNTDRVVAYQECTIMVEGWLRELIADSIAVHAIGPAYFFAFSEFLAHAALKNQPDREHDAPSVRLQLILDELKYLGYFDIKNSIQKSLQQADAEIQQEDAIHDAYGLVAHKTIFNELEGIRKKIRGFTKAHSISYEASQYRQEVPSIVERLVQGITPSEIFDKGNGKYTPSSVAGILNSGWEIRKRDDHLSKFRKLFADTLTLHDIVASLNHLMFHGIEASEVARLWAKTTH
jgi:hypothetical protein